jgi:hypothetical protein
MGSSVSRPTGRTSFSVISAKASAALRWRSTLSEKDRVVNALRGEPWKKFVVVRSMCSYEGEWTLGGVETYSRDIGGGLRRPPVRSRVREVRIAEIYANGLEEIDEGLKSACMFDLQQDSQQLTTPPNMEEIAEKGPMELKKDYKT